MSIQPPPLLCQPWTGLIFSGSSPPVSSPGVLHISLKQFLLEDSNLEQSNLVQEVHTLWWLWARLMKMLDSEAFYSLSGTIPAAFLISSGHSCCILSTFEVHFKYLRCILFEFLKVRTELGDLSGSVLNSIEVPSNQTSGSTYTGSNRTALVRYSKCILNILAAF